MNALAGAAVLADFRAYSSNFGRPDFPLSDHVPMTVTALLAMGASETRAASWARGYADRNHLRAADDRERAGRQKWRACIARIGMRDALAEAVALLGDGLGAAAFHAVIRAAYALERGDEDDLASAFESWEREYLALPVPPEIRRVGVAEALAALGQAPSFAASSGLIAVAMAEASRLEGFARIAATVPFAAAIDDLAIAAAAAFAQTRNFTALHVMTGMHALRTLRAYVADIEPLMPAFWRAFAAAAIVAGACPTLDPGLFAELRREAPADWKPLLERAIAHEDEHVIKATYSAWRLDTEISDPLFRTAAARYEA
jgi:Questin oxidase-like